MTSDTPRKAVAIGGGTGLPGVLRCLLDDGYETTAIVTMADDGGSSGTLRRELGILPPGDLRNCLVGMADPDSAIARLFQYRFPQGGGLEGHALGNLIIAALADLEGGFPEGIAAAAVLLGSRGRVLPSTLVDVRLRAVDADGVPLAGQALIANTEGPFADVALDPAAPEPYPPVIEAIRQADVVVIGPGSLFTSILPNFLVAHIAQAVRESHGRRIYVCNVANQRGETSGMNADDHVRVLLEHGLSGGIDAVIVHGPDSALEGGTVCDDSAPEIEVVDASGPVLARIAARGLAVHVRPLADLEHPARHDSDRLGTALREVL
ncbi:MAG: gluconeogenesis factor YvcK family protein [Coriobacteriia bacterium]